MGREEGSEGAAFRPLRTVVSHCWRRRPRPLRPESQCNQGRSGARDDEPQQAVRAWNSNEQKLEIDPDRNALSVEHPAPEIGNTARTTSSQNSTRCARIEARSRIRGRIALRSQEAHRAQKLMLQLANLCLCASMPCKLLPRQPAIWTQLLYPYSKRRLLGVREPIPSGLQWPESHSLTKTS